MSDDEEIEEGVLNDTEEVENDEGHENRESSRGGHAVKQRPRRRARPPHRSKSDAGGALLRASSSRNISSRNESRRRRGAPPKEQQVSDSKGPDKDSWFDFGAEDLDEGPIHDWSQSSRRLGGGSKHSFSSQHGNSRHSLASASFESGDEYLSGDSFDGDESGEGQSRRPVRPGLQRTGSLRRVADRRKAVQQTSSQEHRRPPVRRPPTRSRSDALMSARRESMRALYRSQAEDLSSGSQSGGGAIGHRRAAHGLSSTQGRRPSLSGSSMGSSVRDLQQAVSNDSSQDGSIGDSGRRPRMERAKSGLEVGALGGAMGRGRVPPSRSKSDDSLPLPTMDETAMAEMDPKWLEKRANRQDEILSIAHDVKERFEEDREQKELEHEMAQMQSSQDDLDLGTAGDDDEPMAMRTKKTALQKLKKVVNKTGAGARSLGKGTVNAISDPKLAAKRFGHLSKDVGKATIKTALDPKKMAKGAKSVTVGTAKLGAGLTKGVAKTTFGATKTVVKGGVSATSTGAKLAVKGTKKVAKGTVRAVKGKDKDKHKGVGGVYDARDLAERNQSDFCDRIAQMVETSDSSAEDKEKAAAEAAAIAAMASNTANADGSKKTRSKKAATGSSILMPTNLVGSGAGSWDV